MFHYIFTISLYVCIIGIAVATRFAQATPLYNTDDAQITSEKSCQFEMNQLFNTSDTQFILNPACTFKNVELSLPITYDGKDTLYAAQLKHPLYLSDTFGIAMSGMYQPSQYNLTSLWTVNLPLSFYHVYSDLQLDVNIGWYQENYHQGDLSWSIAATKPITERQKIGLEYYKQPPEQEKIQAVWSIDVVPDKTSLYLSYGQSIRSSVSHWFGIGLSFAI